MSEKTVTEMVTEFHKVFGLPTGETPIDDFDQVSLRLRLIYEEMRELVDAFGDMDKVEVLDALADLAYVTVGTAVAFGYDFDEAFKRVHQSNMTKVPEDGKILRREDGKILKPDTFTPPSLEDLV